MPNATPAFIEARVLAFALGHPGFGPNRIAAELARPKWWWDPAVAERCVAGAAP
jgi:hypothetical protein